MCVFNDHRQPVAEATGVSTPVNADLGESRLGLLVVV